MMKNLLVAVSLISSALMGKAQVYNTVKAGAWADNTAVWSTQMQSGDACNCNPGNDLSGKTCVNINNTVVSRNGLASLTDSAVMLVASNDTLIVSRGTPLIKFSLSKNAQILVLGTLIVYGELDITDNTKITVGNLGKLVVYGGLVYSGNAIMLNTGLIDVHGNVVKNDKAAVLGKSIQQEEMQIPVMQTK